MPRVWLLLLLETELGEAPGSMGRILGDAVHVENELETLIRLECAGEDLLA